MLFCAEGVLEETDDVLVNVNLVEAEHAVRNVDLRRKKTAYNPYEEEMDTDQVGQKRFFGDFFLLNPWFVFLS